MKKSKTVLVTGGTGFIGSALVRALLAANVSVRVLDNDSRGSMERLTDVIDELEVCSADICDAAAVAHAVKGVDEVFHLAYINGTEHFYTRPELILEVAVKGMMNLLDACLEHKVTKFVLASSSEVYQNAEVIPTDESVPLVVPDVLNPRYSYGGGKIISELLLMNYARKHFERAIVFRPHNVFGPNMGWEHVIPQFAKRMHELFETHSDETVSFPIQGSGLETRAFIYIDDFIEGLMSVWHKGEHQNIYHIGSDVEMSIRQLALATAACFNRKIELSPGPLQKGSPLRRCPNIKKLQALGYTPPASIQEGLKKTVEWYVESLKKV